MSNNEEKAAALKQEGNKLLQANDYSAAVAKYTAAIELDATNAVYFANRAQAHIKLESWGAAISDAESSIALDNAYAKAYHRLGVAKIGLSKYKESLPHFRRVCLLQPKDRAARQKLAEITKLVKKIAFEKAISYEAKSIFEDFDWQSIAVDASYDGPRFENEQITLDDAVALLEAFKNSKKLHKKFMWQILFQMREFMKTQPTLVEVDFAKQFTVCGDVHGQFFDFANIFAINGMPSEQNPYLFNGDFVDRGSWSVECMLAIFAFKLALPNHFFMNRGNHETAGMNRMYGFDDEMRSKFDQTSVDACRELFCLLPLCHVLNKKVMVVHGGLFTKDGVKLSDIKKVDRNRQPPDSGLMSDMLWSDPAPPGVQGRQPSKRGVSVCFGSDVTKRFLDENNLKLLIRSHEVKDNGYLIHEDCEGRLITVFSAPNYMDQVGNKGAFVKLDKEGNATCTAYDAVPHPDVKPMAYSRQFSSMFGM